MRGAPPRAMRALAGPVSGAFSVLAVGLFAAVLGVRQFAAELPEPGALASYEPPTLTRLHAGDGRLLAEFATERRVFVPLDAMPRRLVDAFVAAEDQRFRAHPGVDPTGIARAALQNLAGAGSGRRLVGASSITQQVARNFFLTREVSARRKIAEAMLALRIERTISKDRILELYLNEIYLGRRSYGVAAAALNYFDKSLDELTLSETAFLAGLPKAPANYDPEKDPDAARRRRDYALGRMEADGYIAAEEADAARAETIAVRPRDPGRIVHAPWYAEEVRRRLVALYGEDVAHGGGLSVRTALDPRLQDIADRALRDGLAAYDRRRGWRGPVARIDPGGDWLAALAAVPAPPGLAPWRLAAVLDAAGETATLGFADGALGELPLAEMQWARPWRENRAPGPRPQQVGDALAAGDVVAVEALPRGEGGEDGAQPDGVFAFALRQIPAAQGAAAALDPHTGRVLAMSGGWSFDDSQFNRATQADRQPGSAFKPFVYLAALENGYTPASIVLDAPISIDQGPNLPRWEPENYSQEFHGPTTLRRGLEKSRNLVTVRLANRLGMERISEVGRRFGIGDFPEVLSMSLGAGETTLLRLAAAYAMIVNGGRRIEPAFIERVQDRYGATVLRRDARECAACAGPDAARGTPPAPGDDRPQVADPATAFQVAWMLKGVVDRGTGRSAAGLGLPLAGKTGTSNDSLDAWFIGFAPDLVVGVFVGFDRPRSLGARQTGASVALPVFKAIMAEALGGAPAVPFRVPANIMMTRIDADTGLLPSPGSELVIVEAFRPGTEPGSGAPTDAPGGEAADFDSGLY